MFSHLHEAAAEGGESATDGGGFVGEERSSAGGRSSAGKRLLAEVASPREYAKL